MFSTVKLSEVDTALGPEMKSTGEVMGVDLDLGAALQKAFIAALGEVPLGGGALCSVADADKAEALPILAQLSALGFTLYATAGTAQALADAGVTALAVGKIGHGRPNVIDVIEEGRVVARREHRVAVRHRRDGVPGRRPRPRSPRPRAR